ncbi:transposase [Catalinimonas sp. 4WD22]|uniref:transposase n=1 Tax=Catalinimonas locisalis TaxID=3133978 RepID=UPI003100AC67
MRQFFKERRVSQMSIGEGYFWTDTIKEWKYLLKQDKYKLLIIESLKKLVEKDLITVYCFVIMPNHLHLVWKLNKLNGKEKPHACFNKETAHLIVKDLKQNHPAVLDKFVENTKERSFRIWQRDPMAIHMNHKNMIEQKVDYIHNNPLQEKWNLATRPEEYYWSSAGYYLLDDKKFDFLTDYRTCL